ncbi:DUF4876 domain-containing protein [Capnocytophaga canimorsus]|uniref:DUF4876 domain-containing protein n=1 Tax=Capnocytophaga canimorsus TaxID=28188 RepID=UPI001562157D|nr:DUF4876 domain-containing protein [Capnocytophaga canimorsus]
MKKVIWGFIAIILIACQEKDEKNFITKIEHQVIVTYEDEFKNLETQGTLVKITNMQTGNISEMITDKNGKATFLLDAGTFRIEVSKKISEQQMEEAVGIPQETLFNGSLENIIINQEKNKPTNIIMKSGRIGNIIIKQVYNAGSDKKQGAVFRDQFFELHNNSNEPIALAGLAYGRIIVPRAQNSTNKKDEMLLENGRFDWSKVDTESGSKANTDYVYVEEVLAFPASATVLPAGKSVIVAATALNHKAPLTVMDSNQTPRTYEVPNPNLTIDLSGAKYETYYGDYFKNQNKKPLDSDIDTPATNMEILYKTSNGLDLILDPQSRMGIVIFYVTAEEVKNWKKVKEPAKSQKILLQVPLDKIIDGVNLQGIGNFKHTHSLPDQIDSGEIVGKKGAYSSEAVIRKSTIKNGKKIYQDTNNSSNDFEVIEYPNVNSL